MISIHSRSPVNDIFFTHMGHATSHIYISEKEEEEKKENFISHVYIEKKKKKPAWLSAPLLPA